MAARIGYLQRMSMPAVTDDDGFFLILIDGMRHQRRSYRQRHRASIHHTDDNLDMSHHTTLSTYMSSLQVAKLKMDCRVRMISVSYQLPRYDTILIQYSAQAYHLL